MYQREMLFSVLRYLFSDFRVLLESADCLFVVIIHRIPGTAEGEGLVGLYSPTTFIAGIYFLVLQWMVTWKKFPWNYSLSGLFHIEEWNVCLSEWLQSDVRARIIRSKAQMVRFDFFFALHLGERFYSHTDNLFKDLRVPRWLRRRRRRRRRRRYHVLTKSCWRC